MADKEIWKFADFSGGLNTHKHPKDLKSNEFPVLNDVNISQSGIIEAAGHILLDKDTIKPRTVAGDLIPGKGFYNYFSDYTFSAKSGNHIEAEVTNTSDYTVNPNSSITIQPTSLLWLFKGAADHVAGRPIKGELRFSLKVNNVAIHGEIDASTSDHSYLTVLSDNTSWATMEGKHVTLSGNVAASGFADYSGTIEGGAASVKFTTSAAHHLSVFDKVYITPSDSPYYNSGNAINITGILSATEFYTTDFGYSSNPGTTTAYTVKSVDLLSQGANFRYTNTIGNTSLPVSSATNPNSWYPSNDLCARMQTTLNTSGLGNGMWLDMLSNAPREASRWGHMRDDTETAGYQGEALSNNSPSTFFPEGRFDSYDNEGYFWWYGEDVEDRIYFTSEFGTVPVGVTNYSFGDYGACNETWIFAGGCPFWADETIYANGAAAITGVDSWNTFTNPYAIGFLQSRVPYTSYFTTLNPDMLPEEYTNAPIRVGASSVAFPSPEFNFALNTIMENTSFNVNDFVGALSQQGLVMSNLIFQEQVQWCRTVYHSLGQWLIRAINSWADKDSATTSDRWYAEWIDYNYYKGEGDVESASSYNTEKHFTESDWGVIKLTKKKVSTGAANYNNLKVTASFTSASCTDANGDACTQIPDASLKSLYGLVNSANEDINGVEYGVIIERTESTDNHIIVGKMTELCLSVGQFIRVQRGSFVNYENMVIKGIEDYGIVEYNGKSLMASKLYVERNYTFPGLSSGSNNCLVGDKISKFEIHPLGYEKNQRNMVPGNSVSLDDWNEGERLGNRAHGTSLVMQGEPVTSGGLDDTDYTIIRLRLKGQSFTGDILKIELTSGAAIQNGYRLGTFLNSGTLGELVGAVQTAFTDFESDNGLSIYNITDGGTGTDTDGKPYHDTIITSTVSDDNLSISCSVVEFIQDTNIVPIQGVTEELSILMSKQQTPEAGDISDNPNFLYHQVEDFVDFLNSGNNNDGVTTYRPTNFDIYSTYLSRWNTSLVEKMQWWSYDDQLNDPLFWNEGSRLRITETNFNLDCKTKSFDYFDLSTWFTRQTTSVDPEVEYSTEGMGTGPPAYWPTYNSLPDAMRIHDLVSNDRKWDYSYSTASALQDSNSNGLSLDNRTNADVVPFTTSVGTGSTYFYADNPQALIGTEKVSEADSDWAGIVIFYAAAIYDDGQEGIPSHKFTNELNFGDPGTYKLRYTFAVKPFSQTPTGDNNHIIFKDKRIVGLHIYFTSSEENHNTFWSLGKNLWKEGFKPSNTVSSVDTVTSTTGALWYSRNSSSNQNYFTLYDERAGQHYYDFNTMPKLTTFESVNGYSPWVSTISCRYKAHTIAGRRSFVGNIAVRETPGSLVYSYYNDRMIVSPVNALDTYPYPDNILDLDISDGDEITALSNTGDKVLQFKRTILYVINISAGLASEYYVEGRYRFKGVATRNHVCETADGIFWVNEYGAYLYDGGEIQEITLNKEGGESGVERCIDNEEWEAFLTDNSLVGYNPQSKDCFVVRNSTQTTSASGDAYNYNLNTKTWAFLKGKFYAGNPTSTTKITNLHNIGHSKDLSYICDVGASTKPEDNGSPIQ